ncbi:MAG TPA: inositol monophosphatase family protein [Vicinamibacteria bacterium]|nr:inositol monophosphatase family protein [Vicinamibacteria bacterium]
MKAAAVAVEAALAAGEILERFLGGALRVEYKGEVNLVTEADLTSEERILSILRRRFPDASILSEETGESEGPGGCRFVVDPLDGTTNFAHGYPVFAVSIAYEENDLTLAGVVYDPMRRELFTAERGQGSFRNGHKLTVSGTDQLSKALLATGFPYDRKDDIDANLRLFSRFMKASRAVRRDGSAALDLCYLAAGRFDGFWEEKLGPWDTAAGALIVEEAGGRVTDFGGRDFHYSMGNIVASNHRLHEPMMRLLS